jgi:hypothetical protein
MKTAHVSIGNWAPEFYIEQLTHPAQTESIYKLFKDVNFEISSNCLPPLRVIFILLSGFQVILSREGGIRNNTAFLVKCKYNKLINAIH